MATDRLTHELWKLEIPLPRAFGTPAGPFERVYAVALRLGGNDGATGVACAQTNSADKMQAIAATMSTMLDEVQGNLECLIGIERQDNAKTRDQVGRSAICAISMAVWDLIGHRRGQSCATMWAGPEHRRSIDAYASAFFSDSTIGELIAEAIAARQNGFRKVKMRLGLPGAQDETRFEALCEVFPEPDSIAVEAHFKYSAERTSQFMLGRSRQPMWIEDPMPYQSIAAASCKDLVAAGETCTSLSELLALRKTGIKRLILDVQCLGGPLRFLEAARTLQALGCEVGSHTFASESLHLLAALPQSMPVEVFNWWQSVFADPLVPDADGQLAVRGPGLGRKLNMEIMEGYVRVLR